MTHCRQQASARLGGDAPPAAKAIVDLTIGRNQAAQTPEQIVAQLDGSAARAVGLAGP